MSEHRDAAGRPRGPDPGRPVSVIAHRGFAGVYPENTVGAVSAAVDGPNPPDCIEIDVMPSADGEVVVHHDHTVERVTDAPTAVADRPVWELPYETIAGFEVLGSGQPVPRLQTVLDSVPPDVRVNVELKNPGTADVRFAENLDDQERRRARRRWAPFVRQTFDVLEEYPHEFLFSSFYEGALAAARTVDPAAPLATILWDSMEDGLAVARRYDVEAIHPPINMLAGTEFSGERFRGLGPFEGVDDRDLLGVARGAGWEVNAWTVETWYEAAEARRAGVDGVITDYPDVFRFDATEGISTGRA